MKLRFGKTREKAQKLFIIINPKATKFKKKLFHPNGLKNRRKIKKIKKTFSRFGEVCVPCTLLELKDALTTQYNLNDPNLAMGVATGDGGLHKVFTFLVNSGLIKDSLPLVVVFEGGGMNITAHSLGARGYPLVNAEKAHYILQYKPTEKEIVLRRLLKIETSFLAEPQFGFCFFIGPMVMNLLEMYHQKKTGPLGTLKTTWDGLRLLGRGQDNFARKARYNFFLDEGIPHQGEYLGAGFASYPKIFFNIQVYQPAFLAPGSKKFFARLESRSVQELVWDLPASAWRQVAAQITGRGFYGDGHTVNRLIQTAIIRGQGKDGSFTIDGDIFPHLKPDDFWIKISPGPVARLLDLRGW